MWLLLHVGTALPFSYRIAVFKARRKWNLKAKGTGPGLHEPVCHNHNNNNNSNSKSTCRRCLCRRSFAVEILRGMIRDGSESDPTIIGPWTRQSASHPSAELTFRASETHCVLKKTRHVIPRLWQKMQFIQNFPQQWNLQGHQILCPPRKVWSFLFWSFSDISFLFFWSFLSFPFLYFTLHFFSDLPFSDLLFFCSFLFLCSNFKTP